MRRLPLLLLAGLVACGGADEPKVATLAGASGSPTPSASASKDPEQALLDFTRCMREQGIDMPDPSSDGALVMRKGDKVSGPPEEHEAARKVCEQHLAGAVQPMDGKQMQQMQDGFLRFARCMRAEGIDIPDPDFGGGGGLIIGGPGSEDIDPEAPAFKAAEEKCRTHLPDIKEERK